MKIFIGADHRGYALKNKVGQALTLLGFEVIDVGTHDQDSACDYPAISYAVASRVARARDARGLLICLSGIGHSIAANKVPGAYAALCYNKQAAILSRQHNNANILVLGSKFVKAKDIKPIILAWLKTPFEGGRHARRVGQIKRLEKAVFKKNW
jgi:RpiB/LacA/LacB family sugar-phosphate isomerase